MDRLLPFILAACAVVPAAGATTAPLIDYVTYLGGAGADSVVGLAVDAAGAAYVAGNTSSPDFPVTSKALGDPATATGCAFVTKFTPSGAGIDWSVCLAGGQATAVTLDSSGSVYLAFFTSQQQWFVSYQVAKLTPDGQSVAYTVPVGAAVDAIAVDASGAVYAAGTTGPGLTTTEGAFQTSYAGGTCPGAHPTATTPCGNAFVTKLTPAGAVAWTTYLGGAGPDRAHAVGVDGGGNVWVAGETASPNFPVTPNALAGTLQGSVSTGPLTYGDAFVAKLDPAGRSLLYSTYLGGSGADGALSLAVDAAGAAYIAGGTQSADFPTTAGALHQVPAPPLNLTPSLAGDGFVSKIDASGQLVYSALLSDTGTQFAGAVAVDTSGQAYLSLIQNADSFTIQPTCAGSYPPSVYVLNAAGSAIVATSPIPGAYLVLDGDGGLYSAGLAHTLVFFSTPQAYQPGYGGGDSDGYAAKVDLSKPAGPSIASVLNAASYSPGYVTQFPTGAVAPGEIVSLFGNAFGEKPAVTFDEFPAPLLYTSNCQINAVVPFGIGQRQTTAITVQTADQAIGPLKLPVAAAAPGIFTMNSRGTGQAAVLNEDSTVNSPANPAARGSSVSVFLTGAGMLDRPLADGSLGPLTPPFPALLAPVGATVGGAPATVTFFGQAPGLIAGATQVNLQIPADISAGAGVPFILYVGGYASQYFQPVTIAVQ